MGHGDEERQGRQRRRRQEVLKAVLAHVAEHAIARAQDSAKQHIARPALGLPVGAATHEVAQLTGDCTHKGATCTVEWTALLPDNARFIRHVFTAPERRNHGDATALMRSIAAQADALGIALVLHPEAHDPLEYGNALDQRQIERWYRGLGFVTLQRDPVLLLVRAPGQK
jgi:GNAT superfamily N-acetyltransferase